MSRHSFLFIVVSMFWQLSIFAQNTALQGVRDLPLRIEIPSKSVNETYRVIPAGKAGLVLYYRSLEVVDPQLVNWYFALYDTNMQQVWVKSIPLPVDHNMLLKEEMTDTIALLFVAAGKSKGTDQRFEILRIIPTKGLLIQNSGSLGGEGTIAAFSILNDRGWLGIKQHGKASRLLTIKLKEGVSTAFPLGVGNDLSVVSLHSDEQSETVNVVVCRPLSKKSAEYFLAGYDTTGKLVREVKIGSQSGDRIFNSVMTNNTGSGRMLILGSYGQDAAIASAKSEQGMKTTGIFSCVVGEGKQQSVNFYNFLQFSNAGSFIGESDLLDLKKKALKKNRPIDEYSLDYEMIIHDLLVVNDQYIVALEVYAPQYHSETFTDFDFYGRPYTNSYSVFDGYRFANTIVAAFDCEGKLLWDNFLELRNLLAMELTPKVIVYPAGNNLVLFYYAEGVIGSKIIHEGSVVEKTDYTTVELMFPEDKLLSETKETVQKWYDNYFVISGYQEIKNIAKESGNKRLVFQLTKIQFEP